MGRETYTATNTTKGRESCWETKGAMEGQIFYSKYRMSKSGLILFGGMVIL